MSKIVATITIILWAASAHAANWYVDNSVGSSGNGQSWATPWKNISDINWSSVSAGDTVYISGGTTSQTYNEALGTPKSGTAGNRITISTGQDAGHNGTVIFDGGGTISNWLKGGNLSYLLVTGNVGGAKHMKVQNFFDFPLYTAGAGDTLSNVRLSYIDFPSMKAGLHISNGTTVTPVIELDHLLLDKANIDGTKDDMLYGFGAGPLNLGTAYDQVLIHDNTLKSHAGNTATTAAFGDDGVKWGGGYSFYNNTKIVDTSVAYTGSQHGDGFQTNGDYIKIYNNVFIDVSESIVYHDEFVAPRNHVGLLFYNNLVVNSHSPTSNVARALDLQPESAGVGTTFTDFIVVNNTFVDWTGGTFLIRYNGAASYTNCYVKNNIFKDVTITTTILDPGVTNSNNTTGNVQFVNYTQYAASTNDLHLSASDTVAMGQGVVLDSRFQLDKDGVTRPSSGAWDVAAYEFPRNVPATPTGLRVQ